MCRARVAYPAFSGDSGHIMSRDSPRPSKTFRDQACNTLACREPADYPAKLHILDGTVPEKTTSPRQQGNAQHTPQTESGPAQAPPFRVIGLAMRRCQSSSTRTQSVTSPRSAKPCTVWILIDPGRSFQASCCHRVFMVSLAVVGRVVPTTDLSFPTTCPATHFSPSFLIFICR